MPTQALFFHFSICPGAKRHPQGTEGCKAGEGGEDSNRNCDVRIRHTFLNSRDYLSVDLADRKEALYYAFAVLPRRFEFARAVTCTQDTNLKDLLEEAVQNKTEGLIVKILRSRDSWYRPDERSHAWLKLKKDYLEDVGDSFDLVPVAAWMGTGKRTGVLGAYLLASFNEECDQWKPCVSLGQVLVMLT